MPLHELPTRLIVVDPGHFHASLLQREMYPALDPRVSVYARLGPELLDYLNRISLGNRRSENPTSWELDIHTSADPMGRMLRDRPGDAVVFTGRNRGKIDRILAALDAGIHVFADKPWIISSNDLDKLDRALEMAERKGLAAYDIMTERFEITSILQRELVNTPDIFGVQERGTKAEPGIYARSIHHVMKNVAGVPLRRPAWFFDIEEYGEGLADVGTHVVDLVQWTAFPDQALDYRNDVQITGGKRWPLPMSRGQFQQVTGEEIRAESLDYFCNNSVSYVLKGVHVAMDILWNWEAPPGGGDVYEAAFRGSMARIEVRQSAAENRLPELSVVPVKETGVEEIAAATEAKLAGLQTAWPGVSMEVQGPEIRIVIPKRFRVGHEAHFAQVAAKFFDYVASPGSMPEWERPNMLVKYFVSTRGVEAGR